MTDNKLNNTINKGLKTAKEALADKMVDLARKGKDQEEFQEQTVYNVVFTGTFTKDEKMVIAAMAKFFKQGQEATKRLLKAGRVIKNFDNKIAADKLAKMLNTIGLQSRVELEVVSEQKEGSLLEKAAYKLDAADVPSIHLPKLSELSWKHWAAVVVVTGALIGLGVWTAMKPPVVKGDSFASYEASVKKVIDSAPDEKKAALQRSIDLLTGAGFQYSEHNTFGGNEEVAAGMAYGAISGMTVDEILVAGEVSLERKRTYYREEIKIVEQSIADQRATIAELEPANADLNSLEVSGSQIVWSKGDAPVMEFKLNNNSSLTISRLHIEGKLYDAKGKLVAEDGFTFTTAFGIPPRATKYVSLFTRKDSMWTTPEIHQNWQAMTFKASIENAEDMNGKAIGVDLRPYYKKMADAREQVKKLQNELAAIKL